MKAEIFKNSSYNNISNLILFIHNKKKIKEELFKTTDGTFNVAMFYKGDRITNIQFYNPEYISHLFSFIPFAQETNMLETKVFLNNTQSFGPYLDKHNDKITFYENGLEIFNKKTNIHLAKYFDKVSGIFFELK